MSGFSFYKDEREEHRLALGEYAGKMKIIHGKKLIKDYLKSIKHFTVRTQVKRVAKFQRDNPFLQWMNAKCDNINLQEDSQGLFCEPCGCYHAKWTNKQRMATLVACYVNPYVKDDCTRDREPDQVNMGKFASQWTIYEWWNENPFTGDKEVAEDLLEAEKYRKQKLKEQFPDLFDEEVINADRQRIDDLFNWD